jgi:putative transposase
MTKTTTDRIDLNLVDQLLKDYKQPEDILGDNGILKQFTKALLERAMQVEMSEHLGYEKHDSSGDNSGNSRNGSSGKTLKGDLGELAIEIPRDRNSGVRAEDYPQRKDPPRRFQRKDVVFVRARPDDARDPTAHPGNLQS